MVSPSVRQGEPSRIGSEAQDFTFEANGKAMRLSDLRGKVVVLNFWATWCAPCVEEMPSLNRLQAQIERQNGVVLGISVDVDAAAYQKFLIDHQITFPTYRDSSKGIATSYGTFMYPETFIIDPKGKIVRKIIGPTEWDNPVMVSYLNQFPKN